MVREVILWVEIERHGRYKCCANKRLWGHWVQCTESAQSYCSGCTCSPHRQPTYLTVMVASSTYPCNGISPSPDIVPLCLAQLISQCFNCTSAFSFCCFVNCWLLFFVLSAVLPATSGPACWISICPPCISSKFSKSLGA